MILFSEKNWPFYIKWVIYYKGGIKYTLNNMSKLIISGHCHDNRKIS